MRRITIAIALLVTIGSAAQTQSGPLMHNGQQAQRQTQSQTDSLPQGQTMTICELFSRVEGSSTIAAQRTAVESAVLSLEAARRQKLPDIDASLSLSYIGNATMSERDFTGWQNLESPHLGNSFSLQAQQTVYAGGAISAGIKMAETGRRQAETSLELTRSNVRFVALGQFLDLYKIDNRIRVYEKNIALTEQLIADISEKEQQGMALKNDITRYELQLESLKLGKSALQNSRAILNHQLCNTLGIDPSERITPDPAIAAEVYAKEGEEHWQSVGSEKSPLLRMSQLEVEMSRHKETAERSAVLPKVAIVAADNFNGPITYELPPVDKNINVWYVGVGVQYNLGNLYKSGKSIRRAESDTRAAQQRLQVQRESLDNNIQAAWLDYLQSYVELDTQLKSVELARENYEVINARYLSQLALITDMVDASNLLLSAELEEADARINIVYAYYKVKYAAGEI